MGFQLAKGVFFCSTNGQLAFLDLRKDRYFMLPSATEAAFRDLIEARSLGEDATLSLRHLVSKEILTETASATALPASIICVSPTQSLSQHLKTGGGLLNLGLALLSQIWTNQRFRSVPIHKAIERVRLRKAKHRRRPHPGLDARTLKALSTFLGTRRVMTTQDQCLRWSLAMIHYLSVFGYYPNLVIGVKMAPFGAHAWVQHDDIVLSDDLDNVRPFTPILVA